MTSEQRKSMRKVLQYPAQIDVGDGKLRPCALRDISDSGACITCPIPDEIPDQFSLLLSTSPGAGRRCQVIWRKDNNIGVEFLKPPPEHPVTRPRMDLRAGLPLPPRPPRSSR